METIRILHSLYAKIRNAEHFGFHSAVTQYLSGKTSFLTIVNHLWSDYFQLFQQEDEIFKQARRFLETRELAAVNRDRRDSFLSMKKAVDAAMYNRRADINFAGEYLDNILHNYKNVYLKPYAEGTALFFNLLQDLRLDDAVPHIKLLNLDDTVDELEEYNKEFELVYNLRSQKMYYQKEIGQMTDVRPKVDRAFNMLADAINILFKTDELLGKDTPGHEAYREMIHAINSYIEHVEAVYYRRSPARKPQRTDPDLPPAPPTPEIPHILMGDQDLFDSASGFFKKCSARADDPVSFAATFYPAAQDAILFFPAGDEPNSFPVIDFLRDSATQEVIGLITGNTDAGVLYAGFDNDPVTGAAQLIKNGETLATVGGLFFPQTISMG
jgi:hypothetical protein